MSKILIICQDITRSQPVWDFIKALIKEKKEFNVICNKIRVNEIIEYIIPMNCLDDISTVKSKLGVIFFKKEFKNISFENKAFRYFKYNLNTKIYYYVMVFSTGNTYNSLNLGYRISKLKGIPLWIHTVDPLPSIPAWGEKPIYRKAIIKMIKPYFNYATYFSANNESILNYQADLMKYEGKKEFLPTIINEKFKRFPLNNKPIFLYAGSFYGKRTPHDLIRGFIKYLSINNMAELLIAGNNNIDLNDYELTNNEKKQIKLLGFVENIDALFEKSSVLIDIDANVPNDVFISGKLVKYLNTSKIIFAITPHQSPARKWLESINKSFAVASYNADEIKMGFIESYKLANNLNCEDILSIRKLFLTQFSADSVLKKIYKSIDF